MGTPFSFIGSADAYVDILTDLGGRTGLATEGSCSQFTPKPNSERKDNPAYGRDNFGQLLDSVVIPKPMEATIVFNQMSQEIFAAAFFATNTNLDQAAGSISTPQDVTIIHDKWVEVGKYLLDIESVVVTNPGANTTYVLDTDYKINPRLGMIMALSTGSIPDGETVKFACDYELVAGIETKMMTKSNVRIRVKLDGKNFADGRNFITDIYQFRLNPTSNFSFIGTEFVEVTFEGTLETPSGYDEPMKHIWLSR